MGAKLDKQNQTAATSRQMSTPRFCVVDKLPAKTMKAGDKDARRAIKRYPRG